jgi:hypothetical protein
MPSGPRRCGADTDRPLHLNDTVCFNREHRKMLCPSIPAQRSADYGAKDSCRGYWDIDAVVDYGSNGRHRVPVRDAKAMGDMDGKVHTSGQSSCSFRCRIMSDRQVVRILGGDNGC